MTQQGMSEDDINAEISKKFKLTQGYVEKQVVCCLITSSIDM